MSRNDLGFLYSVSICDGAPVELVLTPSKISHAPAWQVLPGAPPFCFQVDRATGADKAWVEDKLKHLSSPYATKVSRGTLVVPSTTCS